MNQETKLPEWLGLATTLCGHAFCTNACTEDQMRAAVDAIRAEHAQRLTLQRHAADMAQRVADLVAERDKLQHEHHAVRADAQARVDAAVIRALAAEKERDEWLRIAGAYSPAKELAEALKQSKASGDAARKERDELRARLAELERQEPIGYMLRSSRGYSHPEVVRDIRDLSASTAENVMCGRNHLDPIYARPVPAIPEGWKLVNAGALAMVVNALRRDAEEGWPVRGEMADELIAAAPEHKA